MAHPPALSHAVFAALTAEKNGSAYAGTTRLLFLLVTAASLVAIAFSEDSWSEASTAIVSNSVANTPVTVLSYSGSLATGYFSCATCSALPTSPTATVVPSTCSGSCSSYYGLPSGRFSELYLLQCASSLYPVPSTCAGLSSMLGIGYFLRVLFPAVLLALAWCAFVCAEALLRMVTAAKAKADGAEQASHFEARPQGLLPLLLAALLLLVVIVVAQPAATAALLGSVNIAAAPTLSVKVATRPGSSWYLVVAALVLLALGFYTAFRLEALGPQGAMAKLCACFGGACKSGSAPGTSLPMQQQQQVFNPAVAAAASMPPGRAAKSSPWQKLKDEAGDLCVGHAGSRQPPPLPPVPRCSRAPFTPRSLACPPRSYFFNPTTGVSQWERPADYRE